MCVLCRMFYVGHVVRLSKSEFRSSDYTVVRASLSKSRIHGVVKCGARWEKNSTEIYGDLIFIASLDFERGVSTRR